jgi:hypothetical protein
MEIRNGEEFASGFLGAIAQKQEEGKKARTLSPEMQLRLLDMQSEGKIQKAPYANDPQGAMQVIAQKMKEAFGGGPDPMEQYSAVQPNPRASLYTAWREKNKDKIDSSVLSKLDARYQNSRKPLDESGASQLNAIFGPKERSPYYMDQGRDPVTGQPIVMDASSGKYFRGGQEVPASEVGRLLSKIRPQMSDGQTNEITNLLNATDQLQYAKSLFSPDATGPIEGRMYEFAKSSGVDIGGLRGIASLTDDKVKMRTVMGSAINDYIKAITGAQMSEPEARRIMSVMPDPKAADAAFEPAMNEIIRITEMKLGNRLNVLESQGTVGTEQIRGKLKERNKPPTPKKDTGGKPKSDPLGLF